MPKLLVCFVICATSLWIQHPASAQYFNPKNYPQNFFTWPVAAPPGLAANFGELRPNHYHMGLDCRTEQRENVKILAAAEGFIAKVKIEPFGFGRAIYIQHPNGLTTLYAHLNDFYPELEEYVKKEQYRLEKWAVFLDIPAGLLPVTRGQFIAYSGNTGGSQGPHLHFEIRDTRTDKVLNPMLFGLPIQDKVAPDIIRLAMYDRRKSTYEQNPKIISLKKTGNSYQTIPATIITESPLISFAITAYDRYTGSTNQNGIFRAQISDNEKFLAGFEMDSISYDETRYLNAHIDYPMKSRGGAYVQHLSQLPGNAGGIYRLAPGENGVIRLDDLLPHAFSIRVMDANGNVSTLNGTVQYKPAPAKVTVPNNSSNHFKPGMLNVFENEQVAFYLRPGTLYDSFYFRYASVKNASGFTVHRLHDNSIPLQDEVPFRIREHIPMADSGKVIMKRWFGTKEDYKKANYEQGWYKAYFKALGNFELIVDKEPPVITAPAYKPDMNLTASAKLVFQVKDNTEELKYVRATIDGHWVRMSNDKGKNFVYRANEFSVPGSHELRIVAEDLAGNRTEKLYYINFK